MRLPHIQHIYIINIYIYEHILAFSSMIIYRMSQTMVFCIMFDPTSRLPNLNLSQADTPNQDFGKGIPPTGALNSGLGMPWNAQSLMFYSKVKCFVEGVCRLQSCEYPLFIIVNWYIVVCFLFRCGGLCYRQCYFVCRFCPCGTICLGSVFF